MASGAAPTRCIPVSTLRWTGTGSPPRAAEPRRRMRGSVYAVTTTPAARASSTSDGRGSDSSRIGAAIAGGAQLGGLGHLGHGEPRGASLDGGPCHRHGAVAVAVGLHHRAHLGGRAHRSEGLDVGGDGVEGHVRPRARHQPRSSDERVGQRVDQVRRHQSVGRHGGAGPGVQPGAGRRRVERRDPPREEGADGAAEHVTRSGGGQASVAVGHHPHLAVRCGDHRGRALEEHDGPGLGREGSGGGQPVGLRPTAREPLVLAVVRGEHRRRASGGEPSDIATQRRETVAVHHRRPVGAGEHVEDRPPRWATPCPAPDR